MFFSSLYFGVVFILIHIFLFYQFQFIIQLTLVILVFSVNQQTEMVDVANELIKILIKIHRVSCSPMPPRSPPLYSHVTLTNPQISTRNPKSPKSVPETLDPKFELRPPLRKPRSKPQTPNTTNPHLPKPRSKQTIFEAQWKQVVQQVLT